MTITVKITDPYFHVPLHVCHTGTAPNITRNAIVNCTELVTYDYIKETILRSTSLTGEIMAAK